MNFTPTADLLEALGKQIESGTFSLEALERINKLRASFAELQKTNETLAQDYADIKGRHTRLTEDYNELKAKAQNLEAREAAVKAAEISMAVAKKELELTIAHKDDMRTIVLTALRSPIIQETQRRHLLTTSSSAPGMSCSYPTEVTDTKTVQEV